MKTYMIGQVVRNNEGKGKTLAVVTDVGRERFSYVVIVGPEHPGLQVGEKCSVLIQDSHWEAVPAGEAIVVTEAPPAKAGEFLQGDDGVAWLVTRVIGGNVFGMVAWVPKQLRDRHCVTGMSHQLDLKVLRKAVPCFRQPGTGWGDRNAE